MSLTFPILYSIYLSILHRSIYPSKYTSIIYLSFDLSRPYLLCVHHLFVHMIIYLSTYAPIYLCRLSIHSFSLFIHPVQVPPVSACVKLLLITLLSPPNLVPRGNIVSAVTSLALHCRLMKLVFTSENVTGH